MYKDEAEAILFAREREMEEARATEHRRINQEKMKADEAQAVFVTKQFLEMETMQADQQQQSVQEQQADTNVNAIEETYALVQTEMLPRISPSIPRRRQFGEVAVHRNKSATPATLVKPIVQLQQQQQQALVPLTRPNPATYEQKRKVPFRQLRKLLAKATGVHGLITKSTRQQ